LEIGFILYFVLIENLDEILICQQKKEDELLRKWRIFNAMNHLKNLIAEMRDVQDLN